MQVLTIFSIFKDFLVYHLSFAEQHPEMKWYGQPDLEIPEATGPRETVNKLVCEFPTQELYDLYMSDPRNIKTTVETAHSNPEINEYLTLNNQSQTVEIYDNPVDLTGLVEVNLEYARLIIEGQPVPTE